MGCLGAFPLGQCVLLYEPTRVFSGNCFLSHIISRTDTLPQGLSYLDKCLAFLSGPLVQSPALTTTTAITIPTKKKKKSSFSTVSLNHGRHCQTQFTKV